MRLLCFLIITMLCSCSGDEQTPRFKPDPLTVYFEVSEVTPAHGESFIIGLTELSDINTARNIVAQGEHKVIIAEIDRISSRANQGNFDLARNKQWSWYVINVMDFADNSIEVLDGWPSYVEENFDAWVENTKADNGKGRIGFWNYTIKREVPHEELEGM